jgi:hypothetical protein
MVGAAVIALSLALSVAITADSRGQVPGWSYATVSLGIVLLLGVTEETTAMTVLENKTPGLLSVGQQIEPSVATLNSAILLTQASSYVLPEHMEAVLAPARAVEGSLIAEMIAAQEPADDEPAELNASPAEVDPFPLRAALQTVGRADMLSVRLASLGVVGIAVFATAASTNRLAQWVVVLLAAGLGSASGVIISCRLCGGSLLVTYWPGVYENLNGEEQSILDLVRGKPIRVTVHANRDCSRIIAQRVLRFSALTAATHVIMLPVVFGGAWVIMRLWPAVENVGFGYWIRPIGVTALGGIVYVCAAWLIARLSFLFRREAG